MQSKKVKKAEVSNAVILEAVKSLQKGFTSLEKSVGSQKEQSKSIVSSVHSLQEQMHTDRETVFEAIASLQEQNKILFGAVTTIQEQVHHIQKEHGAKLNDLAKTQEEIAEEVRAISRAIDKDAVTVINHERRIVRLERQLVA